MKRVVLILFILLFVIGCGNGEATTNDGEDNTDTVNDDRTKPIPNDILEHYQPEDSSDMAISYWFDNTIQNIDNISDSFCENVFEGNILEDCNDGIYTVFPSDFTDLSVVSLESETGENSVSYVIITEYEDESPAYHFDLTYNVDTNRFSDFSYKNQ